MAKLKPLRNLLLAFLFAATIVSLAVMLFGDFRRAERQVAAAAAAASASSATMSSRGHAAEEVVEGGAGVDAPGVSAAPSIDEVNEEDSAAEVGPEAAAVAEAEHQGQEKEEKEEEVEEVEEVAGKEEEEKKEVEKADGKEEEAEAAAAAVPKARKGAPAAAVDPSTLPQALMTATGQPARNIKCVKEALSQARAQEAGMNWDRATTTENWFVHRQNRGPTSAMPEDLLPLDAAAVLDKVKWGSCALVGNSAILLSGKPAGASIDAHDVVVRLNQAPTRAYTPRVGSKVKPGIVLATS
jgi:hypothetical protein